MKENSCMSKIGFTVLVIAAYILLVSVRVWAFTTLWNWFVVDIFELAKLTYVHSYALLLVYGVVESKTGYEDSNKKSDEEKVMPFVIAFLTPILSVIIGKILLGFM